STTRRTAGARGLSPRRFRCLDRPGHGRERRRGGGGGCLATEPTAGGRAAGLGAEQRTWGSTDRVAVVAKAGEGGPSFSSVTRPVPEESYGSALDQINRGRRIWAVCGALALVENLICSRVNPDAVPRFNAATAMTRWRPRAGRLRPAACRRLQCGHGNDAVENVPQARVVLALREVVASMRPRQ